MADLTRHLANDAWVTACESLNRDESPDSVLGIRGSAGSVWEPLPSKYAKYCYSRNVANEYTDTGALSVWGWTMSVFCTWAGFVLLFVGMFWVMNLPTKLIAQWRAIRGGRQSGSTVNGASMQPLFVAGAV